MKIYAVAVGLLVGTVFWGLSAFVNLLVVLWPIPFLPAQLPIAVWPTVEMTAIDQSQPSNLQIGLNVQPGDYNVQ